MIGRGDALGRLVDLVEAAEVGSGDHAEVVLVLGEAGIGKSRLVRELVDQVGARVHGATVLAMTAQPGATDRPSATLTALSRRVDGAWVPAFGGPADASDGRPGDALASPELLDDLVAPPGSVSPVLLVVEDLQWFDAATAGLVRHVAGRPWGHVVVVVTGRAEAVTDASPGAELLHHLERRHDVIHVRLGRLDRAATAAMLASIRGRPASSAVIDALHRRSGGVPFVVEELLRCCGPDSAVDQVLTATLPWTLEEAVRQQIASGSADRRRVVETIAVHGAPLAFDVLSSVAAVDDDELVAVLRSLVDDGVVREVAEDRFWFEQALVADAVTNQLLGRERRRLHERLADALSARSDDDPAALARHLSAAGRFEELVHVARRGAVRSLEQGASFSALRLADAGLAEVPDDPTLLGVATDAAWRLGFRVEAVRTARRWVDVERDPLRRVEALRMLGRLGVEGAGRRTVGHPDGLDPAGVDRDVTEGVRAELAEIAASGDRRLEAVAAAALAQIDMLASDVDSAVAWAVRARSAAIEVGDRATAARAAIEAASAKARGHHDHLEVLEGFRLAVAEASAHAGPVDRARALNNLLDRLPPHGDEAAGLRGELAVVCRAAGFDAVSLGSLHWFAAEAARARGDLEGFRRAVADARQWWELIEAEVLTAAADAVLALEDGRVADAERHIERYLGASNVTEASLSPFRMRLDAAAGRHDEVRARWRELAEVPWRDDGPSAVDDHLAVVVAVLSAGVSPAEVERIALGTWIADHPSAEVLVRTAVGPVRAAAEDHAAAVDALGAVVHAPDDRLTVPWIGTLRTTLAASLLTLGRRDEARTQVRHVLERDLARWPGVRRDRAEQLARRLDGSSSRPDGDLTRREREVAVLLSEGLTNAQVAERLYIAPKTAAVHVSNILTKLGLSSRAEVAAWVVRTGLDVGTGTGP